LIFCVGRWDDIDTLVHNNFSDDLLPNEVSDLNLKQTGLLVFLNIDVDREMGVDVSHLVLEAFCDTNDQVVDDGSHCAEGGDVLSGAVVEFDVDDIGLWVGEVDGQVIKVLGELSSWTLNRNQSGFDGDLDTLRDGQGFFGMNVLHLGRYVVVL